MNPADARHMSAAGCRRSSILRDGHRGARFLRVRAAVGRLGVVPRVVPNAGDGWPVAERAVVPGGVVVGEPDGQRFGAGI